MKTTLIAKPRADGSRGTEGVDMQTNPLVLGGGRFSAAINLAFDNGTIKTRPSFRYEPTGLRGQLQGSTVYNPGRGLSAKIFGNDQNGLAVVVNGEIHVLEVSCGEISCQPVSVPGDYSFKHQGQVFLFSAENWLIAQNPQSFTVFWGGHGTAVRSPGMTEVRPERPIECLGLKPEELHPTAGVPTTGKALETLEIDGKDSIMEKFKDDCPEAPVASHDSFCTDKHIQWLINGANLGAYAHGRVHQQSHAAVFVGDLIHKRGFESTDDLLLMEEQALPAFGDPIVWPSRLGQPTAMKPLRAGGTANGEGPIVFYFTNGVKLLNTFQFPRESRMTGGQVGQQGWINSQLSEDLETGLGAVGQNAVVDVNKDHLFRSPFGLHFLSRITGSGTSRTPQINTISQEVEPLMQRATDASYLSGSCCGFWYFGERQFCTVGMKASHFTSASTVGQGFVSRNQAIRYTEDDTPIPAWEGLWLPYAEVDGIHQFFETGSHPSPQSFGFLCSARDSHDLLFAFIDRTEGQDDYQGQSVPIEWSATTGAFVAESYDKESFLKDGRLEIYADETSQRIRVSARSNTSDKWQVWKEVDLSDIKSRSLKPIQLGAHPTLKEGTWFQVKIEGLGYCEFDYLAIDNSSTKTKAGNAACKVVEENHEDIFDQINIPISDRWPTL